MWPVILFCSLASLCGGYALYYSISQKNNVYKKLNKKLSLNYHPRRLFSWRPSLTGTINKHFVTITEQAHHVDENMEIWTVAKIKMGVNGVPEFNIYPENFRSSISQLFGVKEAQINDKFLDAKFYFLSKDPKFFLQIFDTNLKQKLRELNPKFKGEIISNRGIITITYYDSLGFSDQRNQFLAMFAFTLVLTERINSYYSKNL